MLLLACCSGPEEGASIAPDTRLVTELTVILGTPAGDRTFTTRRECLFGTRDASLSSGPPPVMRCTVQNDPASRDANGWVIDLSLDQAQYESLGHGDALTIPGSVFSDRQDRNIAATTEGAFGTFRIAALGPDGVAPRPARQHNILGTAEVRSAQVSITVAEVE